MSNRPAYFTATADVTPTEAKDISPEPTVPQETETVVQDVSMEPPPAKKSKKGERKPYVMTEARAAAFKKCQEARRESIQRKNPKQTVDPVSN